MKPKNQLNPNKKFTLDLNLTLHQKKLFEQAAYLNGYESLASFIIKVVQKSAREFLKENKKLLISEKDSYILFKAIENPPRPNRALKKAIAEYKSSLKHHDYRPTEN
ncbi:MAG: hypothetical protein RL161_399 [Bacteroidota bacterium]